MHANIHLPEKVQLHGSITNCFKETVLNYHGTTNIPHQIATNISVKNEIQSFIISEEIEKIEKLQLKELCKKLHLRKNSNNKSLFQIEPQIINLNDIRKRNFL